MKNRIAITLLSLALAFLCLSSPAIASTAFYYTSSPTSPTGEGKTVFADLISGFNLSATRNKYEGISFSINNLSNTPFTAASIFFIDFAAPAYSTLVVGEYKNAIKPSIETFWYPDTPYLSFTTGGKGNLGSTGTFNVLEASYGSSGEVLNFAANFTQYDNGEY